MTSALVAVPATTPAVAAEVCVIGTHAAATVTFCVQDPVLGERQTLTASVTVTDPTADVDYVRFRANGGYLLTDHDSESSGIYSMVLDGRRLSPNTDVTFTANVIDAADETNSTDVLLATASIDAEVDAHTGPTQEAPFSPRVGTAPGPNERFRLAAVGDGVDGSPASLAVADQIDAWDPDVFAYLGDVYDNGSAYEFDTWAGDGAGYGRFRDITNPTVGNHEYRTDLAAPYFAYWGGVPHHYSYDVAGWHVVVLDSTTEYAQVAPGTEQYDWLAADLAAHRGTCTIAYLHHARYSGVDGVGRTALADMWALMHDAGVTMLLTGHAHTYERWSPLDATGNPSPDGMTQFIVGTGGREIQNPEVPEPRIANRQTIPGALLLELGPDDAEFTFASTDGAFTDSGTIPCRQPPAPTPTPTPPPPPPDTTAPTVPAAPAVSAVTPTAATLSWSPASDQVGVAGYTLRRDGVAVSTVGAATTTLRDGALSPERRYAWTVEAFDAAGNRSAPSPPAAATTPYPTRRSRALLLDLRRAPERGRNFATRRFPRWTDADRDGCSTGSEVLLEEARRAPTVRDGCALTGGRWFSTYDGRFRSRTRSLAIDHLVSLREAWRSGAHRWTKAERRRFANDLGYPATLVAVTRAAAADKDGREPQDWLPRRVRRCSYAAEWVAVKWRWGLAVDRAERRFLVRTLRACDWPSVRATSRVS